MHEVMLMSRCYPSGAYPIERKSHKFSIDIVGYVWNNAYSCI